MMTYCYFHRCRLQCIQNFSVALDILYILNLSVSKVPALRRTLSQDSGKFRQCPVFFCPKRHLAIFGHLQENLH